VQQVNKFKLWTCDAYTGDKESPVSVFIGSFATLHCPQDIGSRPKEVFWVTPSGQKITSNVTNNPWYVLYYNVSVFVFKAYKLQTSLLNPVYCNCFERVARMFELCSFGCYTQCSCVVYLLYIIHGVVQGMKSVETCCSSLVLKKQLLALTTASWSPKTTNLSLAMPSLVSFATHFIFHNFLLCDAV